MPTKLISINQAVKKKVDRLRKPIWANPMDHFKIDIVGDKLGPWLHFYSPFNKECNGRDPIDELFMMWSPNLDIKEFEIYNGPLPDSQEYQEAVTSYEGVLKHVGLKQHE